MSRSVVQRGRTIVREEIGRYVNNSKGGGLILLRRVGRNGREYGEGSV